MGGRNEEKLRTARAGGARAPDRPAEMHLARFGGGPGARARPGLHTRRQRRAPDRAACPPRSGHGCRRRAAAGRPAGPARASAPPAPQLPQPAPPNGLTPPAPPRLRHRAGGGDRRSPSRQRTARGPPDGARRRAGGSCPPGTAAAASRLGPFREHAPGGRRAALSRGRRPLSPFPRGDRAGDALGRPTACPARPRRATGKRRAGPGPGQPRPAAAALRPTDTRRAAPPPLGRGAALAGGLAAGDRRALAGAGRGGRGAERSAAQRCDRGAAARRPPGEPPPPRGLAAPAESPRSRPGSPVSRQAGRPRPTAPRSLRRDRTAERGGQGDPSPARLPAGRAQAAATQGLWGSNSRPVRHRRPGPPPGSHRAARVFKPPPGSAAFGPRARRGRAAEARTLGTWPWGEGNDLQAPRGCLPRCRPRRSVHPRGRARHPPPSPRPPARGPGFPSVARRCAREESRGSGRPAGAGRDPAEPRPPKPATATEGHHPPRSLPGGGEMRGRWRPRRRTARRHAPSPERPAALRPAWPAGRAGCSAAAHPGAGRVGGAASPDPEDPPLSPLAPAAAPSPPLAASSSRPSGLGRRGSHHNPAPPAPTLPARCRPRSDRGRPLRSRGPPSHPPSPRRRQTAAG